ncbi:RILP-like protein 2 [Bagarius yarrelli]|uniref:RILP-like protein 2 n=1 Tax=Bagarius yarrelli TaxID=175774 RepID=A0A556V5Y7_BAGYA|nr:RILP-like protein 2 [Bagarius yarrelli]
MGDLADGSVVPAFMKNPLELGVEDVYDISYVIGKDLLKINRGGQEVSDLQFKIVRVLEMFEMLVSSFNLSLEELRMERDNLKGQLERLVSGSHGNSNNVIGPDMLVVDMKDPNRPRFTMQELKEVLQERNQLKAQLLVTQEELQLYKCGNLRQSESNMMEVDLSSFPLDPPHAVPPNENKEHFKDARSTIQKLALIPDTSDQEFFCLHTKSKFGRSQCTFLRRSSVSVLFYWTLWTADHRVEECSISKEPSLIQNYITVCHEEGTWNLQKITSMRFNITLLLDPGSPCEFRPVALGNFRRYFNTNYHVNSGFIIRQKRAWILPGTLWCGHGSRADKYEQLGMFARVDRCCREHDHCDHIIRPFTVNFGIFNPTLFTISHCNCDHRFKQCLLDINDTVSNLVGYTFFNLLKPHCFELIQKRRCTKMNWIGM